MKINSLPLKSIIFAEFIYFKNTLKVNEMRIIPLLIRNRKFAK